ncbi:hypothetical protein A0H81_14309 [Grifola frondosa]|uniref:EH domain-containing protein n=1 Tax=Grifola frondosa TaxID=5627 RepID=A0A1C7LSC1_GRIFR|nr:hypothetical protein A0H81_14309 [Grifola frondosa]
MASSALQARINAFEALSTASNKTVPFAVSRSPQNLLESPISPTVTSIHPIIPSTPSTPAKSLSSSPSPSPPSLGRKTSSIDLKDWVVDDGPIPYVPRQKPRVGPKPGVGPNGTTPRHVSDSVLPSSSSTITPLINFESSPPPPRPVPPLPPRKSSYNSLKSVSPSNSSTSSLAARSPNNVSTPLPPSLSRNHSDSLTVDHTYPPLSKLGISIPSRSKDGLGHVPASSISSFHSVSLSSDGGTDPTTPGSICNHLSTYPMDREDHEHETGREPDAVSLDESYENVSPSSAMSPSVSITHDWEHFIRLPSEPPKLPQRPKPVVSHSSSPPRTASPRQISPRTTPKLPPPPPPPFRPRVPSSRTSVASPTASASASDRSSIISTSTSYTSMSVSATSTQKPSAKPSQLSRPTPAPAVARWRYERVFNGNILAQRHARTGTRSPPSARKPRQAAGWRGLSVDLITNPEEIMTMGKPSQKNIAAEPIEEEVGADERLDGETVRRIWLLSKLEREKLKVIWEECDPAGIGTLDRDSFVKGMWRIDEELRKAQLRRSSPSSLYRVRRLKPTSTKPILR